MKLMAEYERRWRVRHAHESHGIGYGTCGTATYQETTRAWQFLRRDGRGPANSAAQNNERPTHGSDGNVFKFVSELEHLFKSPFQGPIQQSYKQPTGLDWKQYPELAPAWSMIEELTQEVRSGDYFTIDHPGNTLAFGQARYLDLDGQIQDAEPLPVVARVSGVARDTVHITSLGRQTVESSMSDRDGLYYEVPSLSGPPGIMYVSSTPVLQIAFSNHRPNHLAIRTAFSTKLFQLLVTIGDVIELEEILCLPISCTGGHPQADLVFSPADHRLLGIVDTQGNFSTWAIHGRRSRSARMLYRAKLQTSGKIFSFGDKERPVDIGFYFDGWHCISFCSSQERHIDSLWVCNRQNAMLYGLDAEERYKVDVRLDTKREDMYILDAKTGSTPNLIIVLTTVRLLLFDLEQQEWRDRQSKECGPMLLCSWEHQCTATVGLKLSTFHRELETVLTIYGGADNSLLVTSAVFADLQGHSTVTAAVMRRMKVHWLSDSPVKQLIVIGTQVEHQPEQAYDHRSIRIIAQHQDLSVSTCLAEVARSVDSTSTSLRSDQFILRFAAARNRVKKSSRYVAEEEEEANVLTDFVVPDVPDQKLDREARNQPGPPQIAHAQPKRIDLSHVIDQIKLSPDTAGKSGVASLVAKIRHALSDKIEWPATIEQLVDSSKYQLDDIHTESDVLQRELSDLPSQLSISQHTRSLQDTYQSLFDIFVTKIPAEFPDRTRLNRERLVRQIALDLYLSSTVVRPDRKGQLVESAETREVPSQMDSQATTLYDLSSQPVPVSSHSGPNLSSPPTRFAATQPTVLLHNLAPSSPDMLYPSTQPTEPIPSNLPPLTSSQQNHPAPLIAAMARLSSLSNLNLKSDPISSTQTMHVTAVLSHLPDSLVDPAHYDWRARELAASASVKTRSNEENQKKKKGSSKASRRTRQHEPREISLDIRRPPLAIRPNQQAKPHPQAQTQMQTPATQPSPLATRPNFSPSTPIHPTLTSTHNSNLKPNLNLDSESRVDHERTNRDVHNLTSPSSSHLPQPPQSTSTLPNRPMTMTQPAPGLFGTRPRISTSNAASASASTVIKAKKRKAGF